MAAKGAAQMDQKAKIKLIGASAILVVAVIWIVYYIASSMGGGGKPSSDLSPAQVEQIETENKATMEQVKKEQDAGYRGGKPPGPPSGS